MYQDTEVAQIIRKLEKKKQDSVLGEFCQEDLNTSHVITENKLLGDEKVNIGVGLETVHTPVVGRGGDSPHHVVS